MNRRGVELHVPVFLSHRRLMQNAVELILWSGANVVAT
jgi:hypothetical protein